MTTSTSGPEAGATPQFASVFETAPREKWEAEILKVINRGRPEGKELSLDKAFARLRTESVDHITTQPLYTKEDARDLGFPGVAPFTRGTTLRNGDMDAWDVRALHEDPDATETHKLILEDLERGATSIWLRVDPDAIAADDVKTVLADVLLDLAKIDVTSHTDQYGAAEALLAVFESAEGDHHHMSLNLGLDPIGAAALTGKPADLSRLGDFVGRLSGYEKSRAIVVDATTYHNAGAGDIQELAWAIATGVEYVRALLEQGVSADDAFDAINFRVSATCEQFPTIARLRALRTLWHKVGEVFEVSVEKRGARQHAVSSLREMTRDDAYVNVLRGTIQCFGAAVGGAEAITILPFDTVIGLPNSFSRRVARNTQVVLAEESNIGRVNDPAGGSWYVETLTNQLAEAAWSEFQKIEAAGGMAKALADGLVASSLDEINAARAQRLADRSQPITGVSMFPNPTEKATEAKARPAAPELGGLKMVRDSEVFEAMRDRSASAPKTPAVFLACLGSRRDFGGREGFTAPLLGVAGLATPEGEGTTEQIVEAFKAAETTVAVLCSSAKVYPELAVPTAKALKDAGAEKVFLAGNLKELGEQASAAEGLIDGTVALGMDVVTFLNSTLDTLGVQK